MITIQTQSDGVLFNFQDSTRYLYGDGSILTPYNSLTLIADESNVLTFRKSASNDIFITAGYDELGYSSKEEAINDLKTKLFKATGGGSESGITSGDVETMIDNSLEDYYDKDEVDAEITNLENQIGAKADGTELMSVENDVIALQNAIGGKADTSAVTAVSDALTAHTSDSGIHVSQLEKDGWNAKLDASAYTPTDLSEYWTSAQTEASIEAATSGKADTSAVTAVNDALTAHTSDTDIHVSTQEKNAWNAKAEPYSAGTGIEISGNVISVTGGTGSGVLVINLDDLTNNMTDEKWDELVDALENDIPILSIVDASDEDITDIQQFPVNGELLIDENEGTSEITLHQLFGGGDYEIYIQKNGSEDYTITNDWHLVQNELSAGTGIDITDNVISVTGGSSVTVDPTLDSGSTNPVANSAITNGFNEYTVKADNLNGEVRYWSWKTPSHPYGGGGNLNIKNFSINGRCPLTQTNGTNDYIDKFNLVETSAITSAITSASTNAEVAGAKAVYDAIQAGGGGGGSVTVDSELDMNSSNPVENQAIAAPIEDIYNALDGSYNDGTQMVKLKRISQSDYDDLVNMGTIDYDTLYIITPDEPAEENEGGE